MIPERLYPFKSNVEGKLVRGIRSYNATNDRIQRKYGNGHLSNKLYAYRQFFHFVGSMLFLVTAAYVSHSIFNSVLALYVFLLVAIFLISFQEFYLHRKMYRQLWKKSVLDWLAWVVPMGVYIFTRFR